MHRRHASSRLDAEARANERSSIDSFKATGRQVRRRRCDGEDHSTVTTTTVEESWRRLKGRSATLKHRDQSSTTTHDVQMCARRCCHVLAASVTGVHCHWGHVSPSPCMPLRFLLKRNHISHVLPTSSRDRDARTMQKESEGDLRRMTDAI